MKTLRYFILAAFVASFAGCATVAPKELTDARSAYRNASEGPAAQLAPAELHKASEALVLAEESFRKDSDSVQTRDLAYVAQRKAERAEAVGVMAADKTIKDQADAAFQREQALIVQQGKQELRDADLRAAEVRAESDRIAAFQAGKERADAQLQAQQTEMARRDRQDLVDSQRRTAEVQAEAATLAALQASKDKAAAERQSQEAEIARRELIDSEKRTADARAELATLAAVREEERGLVVTLSGGVLFRSAQSTLLSSAQVKLNQVTDALLAVRARNLIVEGHTDSQGSESYNQGLSERRAAAVRDYLVQRGYPADRIQSRGRGEGTPIGDNASPEGRANNRRVEIVIERVQVTQR